MDKFLAMTTFVQIVERGSLTAAADALRCSLSSVVRTLASLERDLGVRLLNRTTRRIHLTNEGAAYLERCRPLLSALKDAEASVASHQVVPQGRLAITAAVYFGTRYVSPIVSKFMRRYPKVSIDLLLAARHVNLVEEGYDVAIRTGHLKDSSLVAIPVGQVRRVVCASPQYLRRYGIPRTPDDIRSHLCVRHTTLTPRDEWLFHVGRRHMAIPINSVFSCNELTSVVRACTNGLGLGLFLSYQAAPERESGRLRYILEEFESAPLPINVIYPHSKLLSTRVRVFIDECTTDLRRVKFD